MDIDKLAPGKDVGSTTQLFRTKLDPKSDQADNMAVAWLRHNNANDNLWRTVHDLWVTKPEEFKRFIVLYRLGVHADG